MHDQRLAQQRLLGHCNATSHLGHPQQLLLAVTRRTLMHSAYTAHWQSVWLLAGIAVWGTWLQSLACIVDSNAELLLVSACVS